MAIEARVTMKEAAERLGVSHTKLWQLVKDGVLVTEPSPLDRRQKLIRVADLHALGTRTRDTQRKPAPGFLSDGAGANPDAMSSRRIKDWVRDTWHRR